MAGGRRIRQAGGHLVLQRPHLGLRVPGVSGEAQLSGRRPHGPGPVADRKGLERRAVQHGQVAWEAGDTGLAQGGLFPLTS